MPAWRGVRLQSFHNLPFILSPTPPIMPNRRCRAMAFRSAETRPATLPVFIAGAGFTPKVDETETKLTVIGAGRLKCTTAHDVSGETPAL